MKSIFRTALLATASAVVLSAAPGLARAQDTEVEELVVTGSRIPRPDLTSVQPLQVISAERMEERGQTNVADALNDLPSVGVPVSPVGDQGSFGVGRNFINIFNLGTQRTLTLVNGRRFVGGNPASIFTGANAGGQVDLNVIPTGLIERIETIQAGGSAVYGSDAIAGVVNIIMRSEYDGVEIDGRYGWGDESYDDWRIRLTAGKTLMDDRLSIYGSYEYNETGALSFLANEATRRQNSFVANPLNTSGSDLIPGSIVIENRRVPETNTAGIPFQTNTSSLAGIVTIPNPSGAGRVTAQFGPGGTLILYDPGLRFQAAAAAGGQGLNLAELSSLISPVERHVATAFARFDVTENIRLKGEFFWSKFESVEPFNQPIFNAPVFGGNSAMLSFSTGNPFLPAATRAALLDPANVLAADLANPGERRFFLSRASVDIGPNRTSAEGDTFRVVGGLEGDLNVLERDFFWNLAWVHGQTDGEFQSPNIVQSRFVQAIDVIRDGSGAIVCRDAAARAAGCVPLNLFGPDAPSREAVDWIAVQFVSEFKLLQTIYEGNFGGDILELPAGMWSFATGFEARYEKSVFDPNEPQEQGVGRSAAITPLSGKFNTKEWYIETLVPVFGGDFTFPLLDSLELEGAYRKVDHSQAGEDKAWSYGFRWRPIPDLMIRAQKARSFRAPAITELFLPQATAFVSTTVDPCDFRNIGIGPNPAARTANCQAAFQALGLPANFQLTSQAQVATVQGSLIGDPTLQNEIARQWSAGFVYQPSFVPGLTINFDWINIKIEDAIVNFNLLAVLQVCYDSPTPPADVCGRFQRGFAGLPTARQGQILGFGEAVGNGTTATGPRTGFVNAGFLNFEGATAGVDYQIDLQEWLGGAFSGLWGGQPGELNVNFDLFYNERLEQSITGLGFDLNREHGEIGNAKWRWKLETTYSRDPLTLVWTANWIDRSKFNNDFNIESRLPLYVGPYILHDASLTWDLSSVAQGFGLPYLQEIQARFVVRNVFDKDPPYAAATAANAFGTYDFIGRFFQVGLTARF